jgi:hypothetical protein
VVALEHVAGFLFALGAARIASSLSKLDPSGPPTVATEATSQEIPG